jgi:hypothetical protein
MSMMTVGTAKALPKMTPVRSSWRIWDPGRSEAHVVLRGVIVRNKHSDTGTASRAPPYTCSIHSVFRFGMRACIRVELGLSYRLVLVLVIQVGNRKF